MAERILRIVRQEGDVRSPSPIFETTLGPFDKVPGAKQVQKSKPGESEPEILELVVESNPVSTVPPEMVPDNEIEARRRAVGVQPGEIKADPAAAPMATAKKSPAKRSPAKKSSAKKSSAKKSSAKKSTARKSTARRKR